MGRWSNWENFFQVEQSARSVEKPGLSLWGKKHHEVTLAGVEQRRVRYREVRCPAPCLRHHKGLQICTNKSVSGDGSPGWVWDPLLWKMKRADLKMEIFPGETANS